MDVPLILLWRNILLPIHGKLPALQDCPNTMLFEGGDDGLSDAQPVNF
jgi:hypothetical protein